MATYQVRVKSPCTGSQTISGSGSFYSGTEGDFDFATVAEITENGSSSWELTVQDSRTGSACYGTKRFRKDPAGGDPDGTYCLWDGSSKDCDDGEASVVPA